MSRDAGSDSIGTPNGPLPTEDARSLAGVPDGFGRFWTPYRMAYIRGEGKPSDASDVGCPFCTAPGKDDQSGLIVYRGRTCFVLMNLFPYNSGHLLVCPYRHIPFYDDATEAETLEIAQLTQLAMKVLREVSHNDGFNIGINQGKVGGAGIADHLHQHILPRWSGDTNFLPIIAQTKTMSRTLDDMRSALAEGFARLS